MWQGDYLITLSLSGDINYLDPRSPAKPTRVIKGHNKGITSLALGNDKTMFTGSYEGRICAWNENIETATYVSGNTHSNQVLSLSQSGEKIYSTGLDDSLRSLTIKDKAMCGEFFGTGGVPKSLATGNNIQVIVAGDNLLVGKDGKKIASIKCKFVPTACAIDPKSTTCAVGAEVY